MNAERTRRLLRLQVHIRWFVLLTGVLSVAGQVNPAVVLTVAAVVCAYNLPALRICSSPRLFDRFEWYAGRLIPVLDVTIVSWAVADVGAGNPALYLFYLYVIVGLGVAYGWRMSVLSAGVVSIIYWALLVHAGSLSIEAFPPLWFLGRMGLFLGTPLAIDFFVREMEREREARTALVRLHGLYEISSALISVADIEHLLKMILEVSIGQTDADRGSLMLADKNADELTIRAAYGLPHEIVSSTHIRRGQGISGHVFATGEPLLLGDLARDPRFQHLVKNDAIVSSISAPINARGQTIGVLNVSSTGRRTPFTDSDLKLLCLLAGQASAAIQNSWMLAELKSLSETDSLTGLYNRRYLDYRLEAECHRATRYGLPLSTCLIDIDDFKNYNDAYGHLQGDDILRELGDLLKRNLRMSDIAARYGGEEFLLIFTQTDYEGAKIAAERLRVAIMDHHFRVEQRGQHRLTVSAGVATAPEGHANAVALFSRADAALLTAKSAGKNRVYAWNAQTNYAELVPGGYHLRAKAMPFRDEDV